MGHDALGRVRHIGFGATVANPDAANPAHFQSHMSLTWDRANRLTRIVDSAYGTLERTYDGLDRLIRESSPQGTLTYAYDAAGRRTQMSVSGQGTQTSTTMPTASPASTRWPTRVPRPSTSTSATPPPASASASA